MKNKGGDNDPNKSRTSLIERAKDLLNQKNNDKSSSGSLGRPNQQNNIGFKIDQNQYRPPPKVPPKIEKEKETIFDKWVKFRDTHLSAPIDGGWRRLGYTHKFIYNSIVNSDVAKNLKNRAQGEAYNLRMKVREGPKKWTETLKYRVRGKVEQGKDAFAEKYEHGKDALKDKFESGKDVAKEKAHGVYESGKEVLKDKFNQGRSAYEHAKDVAEEKFEQKADVLKDKLEAGKDKAKEKAQEAFASGKEVLKEKLSQGKDAVKEKFDEQADVLKDKIYEKYQQGSSAAKEKAGVYANTAKESIAGAGRNIGNAAGNAYESAKDVPRDMAKKATKFTRRIAMFGVLGVTLAAFGFAAGNKLPQAYFEYQLRKQKLAMESQNSQAPPTQEVKK